MIFLSVILNDCSNDLQMNIEDCVRMQLLHFIPYFNHFIILYKWSANNQKSYPTSSLSCQTYRYQKLLAFLNTIPVILC